MAITIYAAMLMAVCNARRLSKDFFVQYKLYRYICLILLEKQFVEVWIPLDAHRISPVTFGNDHGNDIYVSVCPTEFIF